MPGRFALIPSHVAEEMIRAWRHMVASGIMNPGYIEALLHNRPVLVDDPIHFYNMSGEECPPYGCMQVGGTMELEAGDGNYNVLIIAKPVDVDAMSGAYLFNGHHSVPSLDYGTAQKGRQVKAITDGSTATPSTRWQPVVGDWTIETATDGPFIMGGSDALTTNGCKIFIDSICCP